MTKGHWATIALVALACGACAAPPPPPPSVPSTKYIGLPRGYEECLVAAQGDRDARFAQCRRYLEAYTSTLPVSEDAKAALIRDFERTGATVLEPPAPKPIAIQPTEEAVRKQAEAWADCTIGKIRELDDGVTSAAQITVPVVMACRRLYNGPKDEDVTMTVETVYKIRAMNRPKEPVISKPVPLPPGELRF